MNSTQLNCWRSGATNTKNQLTVLTPRDFHSELTVLGDGNVNLILDSRL